MKRVLVISNACFFEIDANGRTLSKLFNGYERESLAQFCVYGTPDFKVCENHYKVSEKQALKSLLTFSEKGGYIEKPSNSTEQNIIPYKGAGVKRTPFSYLLREFVWSFNFWRGKGFKKWLCEFNPEAIVIYLGNNAFLANLATDIAKEYNIPIYIYSTEDYYFKDFNYITKRSSVLYAILRHKLVSSHKRMAPFVAKGFFNSPMLTEKYKNEFNFPCETLFAKSDIDFKENYAVSTENKKICYLGNINLDRHKALIEFSNVLAKISKGAKLSVYGRCTEDVQKELEAAENIEYNGFVSYSEVVDIIHSSLLLVHAEYNDPFYNKHLQSGFSTKIADSVCSGTPLFIYADKNIAFTDFLIKNKCAFVASERSELEKVLKIALTDQAKRKEVVNFAKVARDNCFCSNVTLADLINN